MSGWWLLSYVVLWILMIAAGLAILALAREVETLHKRLDSLHKILSSSSVDAEAEKSIPSNLQQASVSSQPIHAD